MLAAKPTFPRPNRSSTATPSVRISSSSFNFQLSTFNSVSLTPFPATLTNTLQTTDNPATLSPAFATLTNHVKHNPCVCHSYKKHRGVGSHPSNQIFSFRSLANRPLTTFPISFRIRTYAKCARNPFTMNTSKTKGLKLFRINTYKKTGGGAGAPPRYRPGTSLTE